jgi:hypothetical protein
MSDDGSLPIGLVVVLAALVIAAFGWGFLAAGYAHAQEGWRDDAGDQPHALSRVSRARAFWDFVWNGITHLPQLPTVILWNIQNRFWLIGVILGLEACVLVGGSVMKRVERELQTPRRR